MTPGDAGGLRVEVAGLEGALLSFLRQSACPLNNGFTLGHLGRPLLPPTHIHSDFSFGCAPPGSLCLSFNSGSPLLSPTNVRSPHS